MKRILIAAGIVAATTLGVSAQPYPSRPITMVVPFGAGGPTDALARIITQRMSASLGQPILIENVTGAAGTIAIGRVARAAPDGYTLVIGNWASHVVNSAIYKTPFDYVNDFEPVARLSGNPYIIVGKNALPKTLPELIAWLKAKGEAEGDYRKMQRGGTGGDGRAGGAHASRRSRSGHSGGRPADARRPRHVLQGRDCQMVADHPRREHQGGLSFSQVNPS